MKHLDFGYPLAAFATLGWIAYGKYTDLRFRKRAVAVRGIIVRKFPRQRYTSFFIRYEFGGQTRGAEYCRIGSGALEEGQSLTILIDPKAPPDSKIPEGNAVSAGIDWGNCILPTTPLWAAWDFVYLLGALILLGLWLR